MNSLVVYDSIILNSSFKNNHDQIKNKKMNRKIKELRAILGVL